jgi:hypothetical protein
VKDFPNLHRPLSEALDLAAILCHAEDRVIGNDYTFSFSGQRYQIPREQVQAGMRHQRVRVELRLDGALKARYQGRYLSIQECGAGVPAPSPAASRASRHARITTPAARAPGCRVSLTVPRLRYGSRWAIPSKLIWKALVS